MLALLVLISGIIALTIGCVWFIIQARFEFLAAEKSDLRCVQEAVRPDSQTVN